MKNSFVLGDANRVATRSNAFADYTLLPFADRKSAMHHDPKMAAETARLAALKRYDILDTEPEEPFDRITELVRTVLNVPFSAVTMVDDKRIFFKSIAGLEVSEMDRESTLSGQAMLHDHAFTIVDASKDDRFRNNPHVHSAPYVRGFLGIPLKSSDGFTLGVLTAADTAVREFLPHEITILESFAKLVVNEIEMRKIATSDGLTGAMTRRAWEDAAMKEISKSRRHDVPASLVMFDIDHFKQVNDAHGHAAGDEVLREVARRAMETIRESDFMGRLGGEEFGLLLPHADTQEAAEIADRVRRAIGGTPIHVNGIALNVTSSFGIYMLDGDITGIDGWMARADAFLYQAKNGGRNCCRGVGVRVYDA